MSIKIKFTIGGYWYNGLYTTKIFIDDDKSCKIFQERASTIDISDRRFRNIRDDDENFFRFGNDKTYAAKISDEMLAELDALNIFAWESSYVILGFDGEEWALVLTDGERIYRGIGARNYPPNFEEFRAWIDKLVEAVRVNDTTNQIHDRQRRNRLQER